MKRITALLLATFAFATAAQAATVRGKVVHPDGTGYRGAQVMVESPSIGSSAKVSAADDGVFQLRNVPPGNYTLRVMTTRSTNAIAITVPNREVVDVPAVAAK